LANSPSRDEGYTRTYYSYPAKFQAQLPHELINDLTSPGDLVVDPYCGGGTTGLECMILGRRFVGYDINPFAIFISKVKTTKLNTHILTELVSQILALKNPRQVDVLDAGDKECLGHEVSREINTIIGNIRSINDSDSYKNFFLLAAIHAIKIVGRRDFIDREDNGAQLQLLSSDDLPEKSSISSLMRKKVQKMLFEMTSLPERRHPIRFYCASNHRMRQLRTGSVDLIVTSPPYKDVDVEYALLQIQRPHLQRSKRSSVINRILDMPEPDKLTLCGMRGDDYWANLVPSLREFKRVLKKGSFAIFWTGFKSDADKCRFQELCEDEGLKLESMLSARLSDDRVASSRSTHHGKETRMLSHDYLFICRR